MTAVGATMGPEMGVPEVVCQSNQKYNGLSGYGQVTGIITSGGGFSTFFPQPKYQKTAGRFD